MQNVWIFEKLRIGGYSKASKQLLFCFEAWILWYLKEIKIYYRLCKEKMFLQIDVAKGL